MKKVQILYIGRHAEILATVVRLLNQNEQWQGIGALTDEEAITLFNNNNFDIILLGSGIEEEYEKSLCSFFRKEKPGIIIIQHYGGGSGLLASEIAQALYVHHKAAIS